MPDLKPQWQLDRNRKARQRFAHCHERWLLAFALYEVGFLDREIAEKLGVCRSRVSQMRKIYLRRQENPEAEYKPMNGGRNGT